MTEPTATDPETGIVEGGERRVPFEEAHPEVDSWRSPAKRVLGDRVIAERDLVEGAYDAIAGRVLFRRAGSVAWRNRHSRRLRTIVGVRRSRSIPYMRELTKPEADSPGESFQVHDVLSDTRYYWTSGRARVDLDRGLFPAEPLRRPT